MVKRGRKVSEKYKDFYVDDKKFTAAVCEYIAKNKIYKETHNGERLKPSDYIGDCILKISNRLAKSPNFVNYSWIQEMIEDGIFHSINYLDRFNPNKASAFNYFTTIIRNAFILRILNEKKKFAIKKKALMNDIINGEGYTLISDDNDNYQISGLYEGIVNFNNSYDESDNYD